MTIAPMELAEGILGVVELVADRIAGELDMKIYRTIHELLGDLVDLNWDAALFVNQTSWLSSPQKTEILYLEGDDELEDIVDSSHLPRIANDRGMRQLFDVETFRSVVNFEKKRNPLASDVNFINALNFYRENDDFYDSSI
ncbi:DUF7716 domain-containing protein [Paraburkholderia bannensis]|uniref:DUF7716 domain-containing protein n=1 Tax=Paraburkholderia bannensis TaxID=765414 RepID=UPI002AB72CF8|nr:hypothetical protein [Paraburkholderia bannensis]